MPREATLRANAYHSNRRISQYRGGDERIVIRPYHLLGGLRNEHRSNAIRAFAHEARRRGFGHLRRFLGYGYGPANSEFEFLTGNSMAYFKGNTPYVQFIDTETPSLASLLAGRGYSTMAMHAYERAGYNRVKVYDRFGFETYKGIEDFDVDLDYARGYPTDEVNYRQLIKASRKIAAVLPSSCSTSPWAATMRLITNGPFAFMRYRR